jgi:endonuclease-3
MPNVVLTDLVSRLREFYGPRKRVEPETWFMLVLWENVAYLVDDDRRAEAWRRLVAEVGVLPADLLACPPDRLSAVIAAGGMLSDHRVDKLRRAAEIAGARFGTDLGALTKLPLPEIRRELSRFPSIGPPGVDNVLLLAGIAAVLALDSNGLRVLLRLGFGKELKSYDQTYRSTRDTAAPELDGSFEALTDAFRLLRYHGQQTCRRSQPVCEACPLFAACPRVGL